MYHLKEFRQLSGSAIHLFILPLALGAHEILALFGDEIRISHEW